jgi:hypothetical protein
MTKAPSPGEPLSASPVDRYLTDCATQRSRRGQHPDGFKLGAVKQAGLVDDQGRSPAAFGCLAGQGVGGLSDQGRGMEGVFAAQRGHDVGVDPRTPTARLPRRTIV